MDDLSDFLVEWEARFESILRGIGFKDPAHDIEHTRRVVANAILIARTEEAQLEIIIPAAWLHDCITYGKNSAGRSKSSQAAAHHAAELLQSHGYPSRFIKDIEHAIEAHSFSANISPRTIEAKVVQDADRLDAIGAIGIARCFMVGGKAGQSIYNAEEPFPESQKPDDGKYSIDHFYLKLLKIHEQMHTGAGRKEARRRTEYIEGFLLQLRSEMEFGLPTGGLSPRGQPG